MELIRQRIWCACFDAQMALLWPDVEGDLARRSLKVTLSRLRDLLEVH